MGRRTCLTATRLRDRKIAHIDATGAPVVAAGNIGCMAQLASGTDKPVVHTVELLDWATGGPLPAALQGRDLGPVAASSATTRATPCTTWPATASRCS